MDPPYAVLDRSGRACKTDGVIVLGWPSSLTWKACMVWYAVPMCSKYSRSPLSRVTGQSFRLGSVWQSGSWTRVGLTTRDETLRVPYMPLHYEALPMKMVSMKR